MIPSISKTNNLIKDLHRLDQISHANHLRVDLSTGKLARSNGFRAIFEKAASSLFGAPDTCSEKVLASKIYSILDKRRDLIKPENIETIKRLCCHAGIAEYREYDPDSIQQKLADLIDPPEFRNVKIGPVNNASRHNGLNEALTTANIAKLILGVATVGTLAYALSKIPENYTLDPLPENQCVTRPSRSGEMIAPGIYPDGNCLATDFVSDNYALALLPTSKNMADSSLPNEKVVPGNSPGRNGLVTHFVKDPVISQNHSFCPLSDRISWTVPSLKTTNNASTSGREILSLPPSDLGICELPNNSTPSHADMKPTVAQVLENSRQAKTSFNASFEAFNENRTPDVSGRGFYPYNSSPSDDEEAPAASNPTLDYALLFGKYATNALLSFGALFGAAAVIKSLISLKGVKEEEECLLHILESSNASDSASLNNAGSVGQQDASSDPQSGTNENHGEYQNLTKSNDDTGPLTNTPVINIDEQTAENTLQANPNVNQAVEKNSTKNKTKAKNRNSQNKGNARPANTRDIANDIFNTLAEKNTVSNKVPSQKALQPKDSNPPAKSLSPFRTDIHAASKENVNPQTLVSNKIKKNNPDEKNLNPESDFLKWHTDRTSSFKKGTSNAARPSQTKIGSPSKWPALTKTKETNFIPHRLDFPESKSREVNDKSSIPDLNLEYANQTVDMLLNKDANTINVTPLCELIEEGELDGHTEFLRPLLETEFQPETDAYNQAGKILNAYFNRCFVVDDEIHLDIAWDIFESSAIDFDPAYSLMLNQMEKSVIARSITATHLFQLSNMLDDEEQSAHSAYMCMHLLKLCMPYENNDACKAFADNIAMEMAKRLPEPNEDSSVHAILNDCELVNENTEALKNGPKIVDRLLKVLSNAQNDAKPESKSPEIAVSLLTKRLCALISHGHLDQHPEVLEPFLEEEFLSKNHQNENVRNILSLYMDRCQISGNGYRDVRIAKAIASNYIGPENEGNTYTSAIVPV